MLSFFVCLSVCSVNRLCYSIWFLSFFFNPTKCSTSALFPPIFHSAFLTCLILLLFLTLTLPFTIFDFLLVACFSFCVYIYLSGDPSNIFPSCSALLILGLSFCFLSLSTSFHLSLTQLAYLFSSISFLNLLILYFLLLSFSRLLIYFRALSFLLSFKIKIFVWPFFIWACWPVR